MTTKTTKKLTRADLMSAFWRYIMCFQFGWNYERMQSVGYCYTMLPILKKTRPDPEEFKEAFLTNLNFFNTMPVVGAPLILGGHIALEEAGASLETTRERAENVRQAVKALQVKYQGRFIKSTTISLGVAIFPDHGLTAEEVISAADAALYRAKQEGRDRVVAAENSTASSNPN